MSLELSDLMEDLFPAEDSQVNIIGGSQITPINKKAAKMIARQARKLAKKDLLELAGSENIELWQQAITNWMQQHQGRMATTASAKYVLSRSLAGVTTFAGAVSVGRTWGVL